MAIRIYHILYKNYTTTFSHSGIFRQEHTIPGVSFSGHISDHLQIFFGCQ